MGYVFAMTIPGVALALVFVAAVEVLVRRRRSAARGSVGSTGFDELGAIVYSGKRAELDARESTSLLRDDVADGAPGPIDLTSGSVVVRRPPPVP